MSSNSPNNTFYVKEFNPELIAPNTEALSETESFGGSKTFIIGKPGCFTRKTPILMYNGTIKNVVAADLIMLETAVRSSSCLGAEEGGRNCSSADQ